MRQLSLLLLCTRARAVRNARSQGPSHTRSGRCSATRRTHTKMCAAMRKRHCRRKAPQETLVSLASFSVDKYCERRTESIKLAFFFSAARVHVLSHSSSTHSSLALTHTHITTRALLPTRRENYHVTLRSTHSATLASCARPAEASMGREG